MTDDEHEAEANDDPDNPDNPKPGTSTGSTKDQTRKKKDPPPDKLEQSLTAYLKRKAMLKKDLAW